MKPKQQRSHPQLFQSRLDQIINLKHPLCVTAQQIDWESLDETFGAFYTENTGAPAKPTRLMVGLHYLKHAFNESDESVVGRFLENPYWQYFCGFEYFQHEFPIDPSSMTRWRQRIGAEGVEKLLAELLNTAQREGALNGSDLKRVSVDTTAQEKAIAHPTDARLYDKMRKALVRAAKERDIELRQSYSRVGKDFLRRQGRYAHAQQYKRARRMTRRLKTLLGRVKRDVERKAVHVDEELRGLLQLAERLLAQQRQDKNKLYSIHAPEVECLSRGKAHKRYEFACLTAVDRQGCKVGLVSTARECWIVGIQSFQGNPYDGHTLHLSLEQMERLVGVLPEEVYVDRGYRGHRYEGESRIHIVGGRRMRKMSYRARRWLRRRSSIEPVISHVKHDHRMIRNYLQGVEGDKMNAMLAGCGYNLRKLLRAFLAQIRSWFMDAYLADNRQNGPEYLLAS